MALEVGIVGLPLVGKSTIFNALTAAGAEVAAFSKASTKPNIGVAKVPDPRLEEINRYISTVKIIHAAIQAVDVAGLERGASTGHGMGNKFLGNLRDVDAILHVVRCFDSPDVAHVEGNLDPVRDITTVETELVFADLESVTNQLDRAKRTAKGGEREAVTRAALLGKLEAHLGQGKPVRDLAGLHGEEQKLLKHMGLISAKKTLFVANVGEDEIRGDGPRARAVAERAKAEGAPSAAVCGKLEAELAELPEQDREEMLKGLGLSEPALAVLAREAYRLLGLQSFFTAGPKEIRAWTVPIGATAPQAAGAIHSDFERGFIRAEVYALDDLRQHKTEAAIKAAGKLRVEGKNYVMREGDITHFLFNV
jgi:hypothetical protein